MNRLENNARFLTRLVAAALIVICIAVAFLLYERWPYGKRWQEKQLTRILQQDARIESIAFTGYSDGPGLYKIETVSFSIKGKPGSRIALLVPDPENLQSTFALCQIGNLYPFTGQSRYDSSLSFPLLGGSSNRRIDPGVEIKTLGDLITHYDKVHAHFNEWPTNPRSVEVHTVEGRALYGSLREWSVREKTLLGP